MIIQVEPSAQEIEAVADQEAANAKIFGLQPDDWVALFTMALSLSTGLLWFSTDKSARAAEDAARIAERALVELERPFLIIRFVKSGFYPGSHEERIGHDMFIRNNVAVPITSDVTDGSVRAGCFTIEFENHGRTPALLTELLDTYPIEEGKIVPAPVETNGGKPFPVGAVSVPNFPYSWTADLNNRYTAEDKVKLAEYNSPKKRNFYCVGYLRYADIFGTKYILGFCGVLDPDTFKFNLIGDDKLNYMRQEKSGSDDVRSRGFFGMRKRRQT